MRACPRRLTAHRYAFTYWYMVLDVYLANQCDHASLAFPGLWFVYMPCAARYLQRPRSYLLPLLAYGTFFWTSVTCQDMRHWRRADLDLQSSITLFRLPGAWCLYTFSHHVSGLSTFWYACSSQWRLPVLSPLDGRWTYYSNTWRPRPCRCPSHGGHSHGLAWTGHGVPSWHFPAYTPLYRTYKTYGCGAILYFMLCICLQTMVGMGSPSSACCHKWPFRPLPMPWQTYILMVLYLCIASRALQVLYRPRHVKETLPIPPFSPWFPYRHFPTNPTFYLLVPTKRQHLLEGTMGVTIITVADTTWWVKAWLRRTVFNPVDLQHSCDGRPSPHIC